MTRPADRKRQTGAALSGVLPAGGGILAGLLLLFAVSIGDQGATTDVARVETPPVRQAVISLPEPESASKGVPSAKTSFALLPPKPAAAEVTRRIEAGLPLKDPVPAPAPAPAPKKTPVTKSPPVQVDDRPRIALVIDDMGFDRVNSALAVKLPAAVTLSYLPNAPDVQRQVRVARLRGHPVMLHLPMEAPSHRGRPGINVLALKGSEQLLRDRMTRLLGSFDGYIGVNNHMGSRFTRDPRRMEIVMSELRRRGLFFVDSRTSNRSVGGEAAQRARVAYAVRDVFIDHHPEPEKIRARFAETERVARRNGSAIAIAHPRTSTMKLLDPWVRTLKAKGFNLVPVTNLLKRPPPNKLAQLQPGE